MWPLALPFVGRDVKTFPGIYVLALCLPCFCLDYPVPFRCYMNAIVVFCSAVFLLFSRQV